MDENTIKELLLQDKRTHFDQSVSGKKLTLTYDWTMLGRKNLVSAIQVYLTGVNPYTGQKIAREEYLMSFHGGQQSMTRDLPLYGEYDLHFDAALKDGTTLRDYVPPETVFIEGKEPYVHYDTTQTGGGWIELSLEMNCARRVSGKLWVRHDGRCHRLPPLVQGMHHSFYLPYPDAAGITLLAYDDSGDKLPTPKRMPIKTAAQKKP